MNYIIYSGYCNNINPNKYGGLDAQSFFDIWYSNTIKYTSSDVKIRLFGPSSPNIDNKPQVKVLSEYDNIGHVEDLIYKRKHGNFCGWTCGIILGMLDAYIRGVDFIFKEQDCLAFGPFVDNMYNTISDNDIIYGTCKIMGIAQSLFLVKRDAIPVVISHLFSQSDLKVLPEYKFGSLPIKKCLLPFGYDRDRPFNINDKVFYVQQLNIVELNDLKSNNLI